MTSIARRIFGPVDKQIQIGDDLLLQIKRGRPSVGLRDPLPDLEHGLGDVQQWVIVFFFSGVTQFPLKPLV